MKDFKVSVIIPVYNAEKFLREAVNSAIHLDEVGELILIEDNSPDGALELCRKLEKQYDKVKLLTHPNNENRGAGASRNLGIQHAKFDFIAFLDADDKYLKHRFLKDKRRFLQNTNVHAVYSIAVAKDITGKITRTYGGNYDFRRENGNSITPRQFYENRLKIKSTLFCTNSITIKKDFLLKFKLFDERLRLHQDSELWKRLMRKGNFYAGELQNPVSVIREHDQNRITHRNFNSELKFIAVSIDNIGLSNLYNFEIEPIFSKSLRLLSSNYENHWKRRLFYYSNYLRYSYNKKAFLGKIKQEYKNLEI